MTCLVQQDPTFASRVFPGCRAVNFQRAAMEDLFKVDLQQKREAGFKSGSGSSVNHRQKH